MMRINLRQGSLRPFRPLAKRNGLEGGAASVGPNCSYVTTATTTTAKMMNDSISPPLSFEISFVSQQQSGHACLISAMTWDLGGGFPQSRRIGQLKLIRENKQQEILQTSYVPAWPNGVWRGEEARLAARLRAMSLSIIS